MKPTGGHLSNSKGVLGLPMSFLLIAVTVAALGSWSLLRHWRELVALQLRLDRCVEKTAISLTHKLQMLEHGNQRIRALRASLLAGILAPEIIPVIRSALAAQAAAQDLILAQWKIQQISWLAGRGCDRGSDIPIPLPSIPWIRDPPDPIGPRPLRRAPGKFESGLFLQLSHPPRHAAALIKGGKDGTVWKAKWDRPRSPLEWASFD